MKDFSTVIYPSFSRLFRLEAKLPSVTCKSSFSELKSQCSFATRMLMICKRTRFSNILSYRDKSNFTFRNADVRLNHKQYAKGQIRQPRKRCRSQAGTKLVIPK